MKMSMDFWTGHVTAAKGEGGSARAYAKRHGLSLPALYYWQRKLRSVTPAVPVKVSKFVALRVADTAATQRSCACTLVMPSGMRLEMLALPSPQWLATLADATRGAH